MKIAVIGSGNIATFFAGKFHAAGFEIVQVISARMEHAKELAGHFQCAYSDQIDDLSDNAETILFAVRDDVLLEYAADIRLQGRLVIHSAGSVHLDEIKRMSDQLACLWCVYSINKNHLPDNENIPLVVNANNNDSLEKVRILANAISGSLFYLDDEQKSVLHLAAVFANNFTNHLYAISKKIADENHIPFETLLPIISDTAEKLYHGTPAQNQTGPAIRHDAKTISKHIALLNEERFRDIYRILTESIQNS